MPTMNTRPVTGMMARMLICVNSHGDGKMGGYLYNQFLPERFVFHDVVQLIEEMDNIFNTISFPQAFLSTRTFGDKKTIKSPFQKEGVRYMPQKDMINEQGKKGTFMVSVQFRQNATWQGTIVWMDEEKKQHFRSALEMLKLMDEALAAESDTEETVNWE